MRYGKVNLMVSAILADDDDSDSLPERIPLTGTALCVPKIITGYGNVGEDPTGSQEVQLPLPVPCTLVDGALTHEGLPHVTLLSPTGGWEWEVRFNLLAVDDRPLVLEPFRFPVVEHTAAELADDDFAGVNIAQFAAEQYRNATPGAVSEANILEMLEIQATVRRSVGEAEDQAQAAADSAAEALSYRNSAQGHASNATAKATAADQAREAAVIAQELAEAARAAAEAARDAAQAAQGDAEAARDAAQAAQGDAEAARDAAQVAQGDAEAARDAAQGHANTAATQAGIATTKAGEAGTARDAAVTARSVAEAARDEALAAKVEWKGPWDAATAYLTRDAVSYEGSSWWAVQPSTGQTPAEGAYWSLLAAEGARGPAGEVSQAMLDAAVASLVDGAPEALDTLTELATALGNDPNFATTVSTQIGQRALIDGAPVEYDSLGKLVSALIGGELGGSTDASLLTGALTGQVDASAAMVTVDTSGIGGDGYQQYPASDVGAFALLSYMSLGDKADIGHTHTTAQVTGLDTALAGKASTSHTHTPSSIGAAPAAHSHTPSSLGVVARSGTAVTLWSGTQAQYDALAPATRNAAGFVAVIS